MNCADVTLFCFWGINPQIFLLYVLTQANERYAGTYIIGKRKVTEVGSHQVRMKDESEWFKIPEHHPAIVDMAVFQQVREKFTYTKCRKTKVYQYPLKGKVFCGSCHHALPRTGKYPIFSCRYMKADPQAACYHLKMKETELEETLYQVISKQAQVILNIEDISDVGELTALLSKKTEYQAQVKELTQQKMRFYEAFLQGSIDQGEYNSLKAPYDTELERLKQLHRVAATTAAKIQERSAQWEANHAFAKEIVSTGHLTAVLADALIDKVYVHPNNHLEIVWKATDFISRQW